MRRCSQLYEPISFNASWPTLRVSLKVSLSNYFLPWATVVRAGAPPLNSGAPGTVAVGRPDVQGFVGSLVGLGATKGVFVTTSSFSAQEIEFAKHLSQRVILIDGQRLGDLMIEHNIGVRLSRSVDFKRLDEDFFSEDE